MLLFVRDTSLGCLLPAVGMPQTIRGGPSWRRLLERCAGPGIVDDEIELPPGRQRRARAVCDRDVAIVAIGGRPVAADLAAIAALLPLVGAILRGEMVVALAEAEAAESRRAAGRAELLSKALEAARAEASKLNVELRAEHERKDEFLAMLAHELRNPMAPMASAIAILRHPRATTPLREQQLDLLERQLRHMTRMVDDLLDVSRVTRGRVDLRLEPVDLRTILSGALETTEPMMGARDHRVERDLPPDPLPVLGDAVRLTQVFSNLLNNAAKYTDRGGRITVTAWPKGGDAVVTVRDNGIGLSEASLARIFDLFAQVPVSVDRSLGGLGIGLTLTRRLLELHGGSVQASSDGVGRGSTFTVRIPLATTGIDDAPSMPATSSGDDAPLRILVVDDNIDAAEATAEFLRLKGHCVDVAHSGDEALERAAAAPPDLVMLDLGLPGMSGVEVGKRLRQTLPRSSRLVAVTGYGAPQDRLKTHEAGFDGHHIKPLMPEVIEDLLDGLIGELGRERAGSVPR